MNIERLQYKGMLRELEAKERNNVLAASGIIPLLRTLLNPYETDITKIEVNTILENAQRLKTVVDSQKETVEKIRRLKDGEEIA